MILPAALPNKTTATMVRRLVRMYLNPYIKTLLAALGFMIVASAMTAAVALLMEPVLDDVLNAQNSSKVIPVGVLAFMTFLIRGVSTYLHTVLMTKVSQSIVADIQKDLFAHFMRLDLAFFHANPSGQLISRVINDVQVVRVAISDSMTGIGKNLITLIFLVGVMFSKDWVLALSAFLIFPFAAWFVAYLGKKLRTISGNTQGALAGLSDRLSQIFQGIRQVKAYGMQDFENERAARAIENVKKLNMKAVRTGALSTPVNEVLVGLVMFGIIIYGGYQTSEGAMTAGELGAFLAAFIMAYEPMKKLAKLNNALQIGLGAGERILDMLDITPQIDDLSGAHALQVVKPEIAFKDVSFRYDGAEDKALDTVSFVAKPGKVTALVGPSGGGKSTIMNLIPRFYDVQEGQVLIDGQSNRELTIESLRGHIALVSQDITIFDDTIAANIAYGRFGATQQEIEAAAQAAAAHEFITGFPEGYNTQVGEDGVKLSGGQRQRIAIARAILRDAPILLLDEATSALDNESERLIQQALEELEKGRTTIVIAHRLSTVRGADQIIMLDHGRIVEQGTHDTLLEKGGLYAHMYKTGLKE